MRNVVEFDIYYSPREPERAIACFVERFGGLPK
jgi:hypothetical protein